MSDPSSDRAHLRLVSLRGRFFALPHVVSGELRADCKTFRVHLTSGKFLDFEGADAVVVINYLRNRSEAITPDRDNGQRAEAVADAPTGAQIGACSNCHRPLYGYSQRVTMFGSLFCPPCYADKTGRTSLLAVPPAHGARPDPADAVMAASAADWTDPDCQE